MAANIHRHRDGTELRHCRPIEYERLFVPRWKGLYDEAIGVQITAVAGADRFLVLRARSARSIRWLPIDSETDERFKPSSFDRRTLRHPLYTLSFSPPCLGYVAHILLLLLLLTWQKGKGSQYSIAERRVPELIPVLGSQPAGEVSRKPDGRLPLLSARPAVTLASLKRAATNFAAWWREAR